jgi:hypothetical protein
MIPAWVGHFQLAKWVKWGLTLTLTTFAAFSGY